MENDGFSIYNRFGKSFDEDYPYGPGFNFLGDEGNSFGNRFRGQGSLKQPQILNDRQFNQDYYAAETLEEQIPEKPAREFHSPGNNVYSMTIKGFGKNDNLQCTSNTKITTTKHEFSPFSQVEGPADGPRVDRILFNTENDQVIKNMPEFNLMIRSRNESRVNQSLIFEPLMTSALSNGRRIFQLSGFKEEKEAQEFENFIEEEDQDRLGEIKLRLNFDNHATPIKGFRCNIKGAHSGQSSAEKSETYTELEIGEAIVNRNLKNTLNKEYKNEHIFNSGNKGFCFPNESPYLKHSLEDSAKQSHDFVTKRFTLGKVNFDAVKNECRENYEVKSNLIKFGASSENLTVQIREDYENLNAARQLNFNQACGTTMPASKSLATQEVVKQLDDKLKSKVLIVPSKLEQVPPHMTSTGEYEPRVIKCNCKNSKCLKLYCECFRNGRYCNDCNCNDCHNIKEHEDSRQKAIKGIKHRNPQAFKPRIAIAEQDQQLIHTKGCSCKKSGCNKKYCECFLNGVQCTEMCKCTGCKNCDITLKNHKDYSEPHCHVHSNQSISLHGCQVSQQEFDKHGSDQKSEIAKQSLSKGKINHSSAQRPPNYDDIAIPKVNYYAGGNQELVHGSNNLYQAYSPIKGVKNVNFSEQEFIGKKRGVETGVTEYLPEYSLSKRLKSIQDSIHKGKENQINNSNLDHREELLTPISSNKRHSSRIFSSRFNYQSPSLLQRRGGQISPSNQLTPSALRQQESSLQGSFYASVENCTQPFLSKLPCSIIKIEKILQS